MERHDEQTYRNNFGLKKPKCIDWLKLNATLADRQFGRIFNELLQHNIQINLILCIRSSLSLHYRNNYSMKNLLEAKSRAELRNWLIKNHNTETECWVVVKRGRPKDDTTFWYIDAVEEALCFGWIDSTTKKIDDSATAQKLCPRKPKSNWSELNKERCRRMERLGLMTDAGRAVLPDMSEKGFIIDSDILQKLKSDPAVWSNFLQLPKLYVKVRIDTIQIKRRQPELFKSRLAKFIENTRKGIIYGEWNDNGRLLP